VTSIATKKPLNLSLPRAIQDRIQSGKLIDGQEWPCTVESVAGAIVTISFNVASDRTLPQVTCPIAESRYVRLPIRKGDQGVAIAATARLGGVTGLGAGLAPLAAPSNLGGLLFVPLGNANWNTIDPDAVVIQAPNGAKILTDDSASEIIVDQTQVKVIQGSTTVTISGGNVTIDAPNDVTVNCPTSHINGTLDVSGDTSIGGNLSVGGDASVTGAVSCATMTCSGAGSFATLTVGGKSFAGHEHAPGTYQAGSTHITGQSGVPV